MSEMEEEGEVLEFDDYSDVEDVDGGGAIVTMGPEQEDAEEQGEFYENLATKISEPTLETLSTRLFDDLERDRKSREKRDKDYAEAIRRTGLGNDAPGGAEFQGASKVVHPLLTEACVDFSARAIKELMPPNGPVKVYVPGDNPPMERFEKAERKKNYMNWQFLVQMPDFRSELEQLLTQLPLGGSQYLRLIWDSHRKRPMPTYWPIDDVFLPYAASNYYTADRVTFREWITSFELKQRIKSGYYRDLGEGAKTAAQPPDESAAQKATDKIEGKDDSSAYNEDGLRAEYEMMCWIDFDEEETGEGFEDGLAPYLVTLDSASRKVARVVRNWEEEDETKEPMYWTVEFPFVPWRGAYSIGMGQMAGSLSGAATGALRALLDSAHINNLPTLLRLKGSNTPGQSLQLNVAQVTEVEGGVTGDDIRKLVMAVPFNPPSEVLYSLLQFVVDAGKGIIGTTFEDFAQQQKGNVPVGTALAMVEEGLQVMSAIHLRLFQSMNYVLKILNRINSMYLEDEEVMNDVGEVLAQAQDFALPLDVVPVADPNIFSDVQRMAQIQIISERAERMPQLYNLREVEKRLLERTKIPNSEALLLPVEEPEETNAVNENAAMTLGRPVAAFPEQDHLAHLQVHMDYMMSPTLGGLIIIAPQLLPGMLDHLKEHIALWYVNECYDLLQASLQKDDEQMKQILAFSDSDTRKELDRTLAVISQKVVPMSGKIFAAVPQVIQRGMEMLQSLQPKPEIPMDPNAQAAIAQKEQSDVRKDQTERLKLVDKDKERAARLQERQENLQFKFMELSSDERQKELDRAHAEAEQSKEYAARLEELVLKQSAEDERLAATLESKETVNAEDNLTALRIAAAEIRSGEKVALETGTGINPDPRR